MTTYKVIILPAAEADLLGLYHHIAAEAGDAVAGAYIERIEQACLSLEVFPMRGTRRDDLRPGLRTMGFERRITITFEIIDLEVVISRIFYGGRDVGRALETAND